MTTKYLDIDSTYRDRTTWPLPAQFQALVAPTSGVTDSVSTAATSTSWQSNRFVANAFGSVSVQGTVASVGYGANNTPFTVVIVGFPGQLSTTKDYYRHAVLSSPVNARSRILSYEYLGNDAAAITLLEPLNLAPGAVVTITDSTDLSVLRIFVPTAPNRLANYYAGRVLYDETTSSWTRITDYNPITGSVTVAAAIPGWSATDSFSVRRDPPPLTGTFGASTPSAVSLGPNSETNLVGSFLRVRPTYPSTPPGNETRRIVSYDPTTFVASVYPPFSANPTGFRYELLPFSYDNHTPFVFIGTSQSDFVVSSVRLLHMTLPSDTLNVGYGGTAKDYPYFYVQLTPLNTVSNNITSSNNPNATSSLFKATRDHSNHDARFISFSGDGTRQKVMFKVDTDFNFRVILPNGQTFETRERDTASPSEPNPLLQISALFEIIRE